MSRLLTKPSGARAKWTVLALWLVAIFVAVGPSGAVNGFTDAEQNDSASFLPGDAESTKALEAAERLQGGELAVTVFVYRREAGLTPADFGKLREDVVAMSRKRFEGVVADGPTAASGGKASEEGSGAPGAGGGAQAGAAGSGCAGPTTALPGQPPGYRPFVGPVCSADGRAALVFAYIKGDGESETILDPVQFWRETASDPGGGLEVKVTGATGYAADAIEVFESINGTLLAAAGSLVLLLLILIYRSPIFLFIPLIAVAFAEMLSRALGYLVSELGVTINGQSSSIMSVLVLGAGTDYALLLVARYREELHRVDDKHEAMRRALASAGPAVFASGVTVIAALICLTIAKVNGTAGLGPIGALGVFSAMVSMLTLLPALLTIFGRRAFWPFVPHTPGSRPDPGTISGFGRRVVLEGGRMRALAVTAAAVLAAALLLPLTLLSGLVRRLARGRTPSVVSLLEPHTFRPFELRRVQHEHVADETHGFWKRVGDWVGSAPRRVLAGALALLAVCSAGWAFHSNDLTTADSYTQKVESVEGQELLERSFPAGANAPTEVIVRDPSRAEAVGAAVKRVPGVESVSPPIARGEDGVLFQATLGPGPYTTDAFDIVEPLRAAARSAAGPDGALVGGASAVEFDVRDAAAWDSTVIPPIVLAVVLLILVLLLRALVGPLLLIATVILSFIAAMGVGYFVFDVIFGFPGADPSLPLFAFVFLVALGVDYNIFLVARGREETLRFGTRTGMLRALAVTGGVITSAGIVLAGTFSVLAVLPLVFLTEIGFVVAFGVLLDTFIVRSVLVPSIALVTGPRFWWPSRLAGEDAERTARGAAEAAQA